MHNPAHPGEVLREWLEGISITDAASRLGVTRAHLSRILNGHAGITPEMALRLSAALGTTADVWLQMQLSYDL
jgi:addiction module HigA family antidote